MELAFEFVGILGFLHLRNLWRNRLFDDLRLVDHLIKVDDCSTMLAFSNSVVIGGHGQLFLRSKLLNLFGFDFRAIVELVGLVEEDTLHS